MTDYSKIEIDELINESKQGNQNAFGEIVRRNQDAISNVVYGMLGDTVEADDVGQEVFIRFFRNMHQFKAKSSLKTYLTRIAINLCLNELKKRKKNQLRMISSTNEINKEHISSSDQDQFEVRELVQKGLLLVEIEFRTVIVLRLIEGYSTKEVSEILGLPQGTVLSRLARGQKKLKKILTPIVK